MMKPIFFAVLTICSFASCRSGSPDDDSIAEDDSISGAEMPPGKPLALDSSHNVRVVEHGLQFDEGYYFTRDSAGQKWVPSSHRYGAYDTAFFNPVIKGYGVADGKVAVSLSSITIRDAEGKVIREGGGNKQVSRFPESEASYATFYMPVEWLDSLAGSHSAPHYDIAYTLKDRITGKSIEGLYRIHVAR